VNFLLFVILTPRYPVVFAEEPKQDEEALDVLDVLEALEELEELEALEELCICGTNLMLVVGLEMLSKSFGQCSDFCFKFFHFDTLSFCVKRIFLNVIGKMHVNGTQDFDEVTVGCFAVGQNEKGKTGHGVQTFQDKSVGVQGINACGHDRGRLFGHGVEGMKRGTHTDVIVVGKFWDRWVEIALVNEGTRVVGDV
jgi:hypothetical protein